MPTISKEIIIKHAYGLFLQKGYKSVSLKDIMEVSNLSKGAIYHHFESKEVIFLATLEQYFFATLDIDKAIFEGLSFRKQIKVLYLFATDLFSTVEEMGENGIPYPIKNLYGFQLECENFPEIREKFKNSATGYRKLVEELVGDALVNKEVKAGLVPEIISYQIIGMIEGIAIHHSTIENNVRETMSAKYERVFDSYLDLICTEDSKKVKMDFSFFNEEV